MKSRMKANASSCCILAVPYQEMGPICQEPLVTPLALSAHLKPDFSIVGRSLGSW